MINFGYQIGIPEITFFDVSYPSKCCVDVSEQEKNMSICLENKIPRLLPQPQNDWTLSIVCYGPSLLDTWQDIKRPIMTVSGAHDFLIERGIVPDFHVDTDPRKHKSDMLTPHKDVVYLIASACNPDIWGKIKSRGRPQDDLKAYYWHAVNGQHTVDWILKHDDGSLMISGGSTAGLCAIHIGGVLGITNFNIYGMDCSYKDGARHAGLHGGPTQKIIDQEAGGKVWQTSRQMLTSAEEFEYHSREYGFEYCLHGEGYLQSKMNDLEKNGQTKILNRVRFHW
jgi:hypothetical protein